MGKRKRNVRKIKRTCKLPIAKLQRQLWVYCKLLTRKIHGNTCYTCNTKNLSSSNWQTGHLFSKATLGANLKYDLRVLRPQCLTCNIWHGGRGADFISNMIIREGQAYVDQLSAERNLKVNPYEHYTMLISKYKIMLEDLDAKTS